MTKFLPYILVLTMCIGIVPPEHFLWIFLVTLVGYLILAFYYDRALPGCAKKIPPTIFLTLMSVAISSLLIFSFFHVDPSTYPNDPKDYHDLARTIVRYGKYAREVIVGGETKIYPTAYRPVGYPLFIAAIYFITGTVNYKFVVLLQYVLNLVAIFLFWKILCKFFSPKISIVATILYSLNLPLLFASNVLLSETLTQFIITISAYLLVYKYPANKFLHGMFLGVLTSFLVLIRTNYLFYLPVVLVLLYLKAGKRSTLALFLAALLMFGIWGYRNYNQSGKLIFTSVNGGINLFLGNNSYVLNGRASTWPPAEDVAKVINNSEDASDSASLQSGAVYDGIEKEAKYDALFSKEALDWIKSHPGTFIKLVFSRLSFLFSPHGDLFVNLERLNYPQKYQYYFLLTFQSLYFWFLFFLSLVGVFDKRFKFLLLLFMPYLAVFLISFSVSRFQMPLYIPMAILATFGIKRLIHFKQNVRWIVLALLLFVIQFSMFRKDLGSLMRYKFHFMDVSSAEATVKEPLIKKVYSEDRYLSAWLENKYDGVTTDSDIFSNVEGSEGDILLYKDVGTAGLPLYKIKKIEDLGIATSVKIGENLASGEKNRSVKAFEYYFRDEFKFVRILATIYKHSSIEIVGKSSFKMLSYPVENDFIKTNLLIPRSFFGNKIEIYVKAEEFPLHSTRRDMGKMCERVWDPGLAVVESVDLVN